MEEPFSEDTRVISRELPEGQTKLVKAGGGFGDDAVPDGIPEGAGLTHQG